MATSAIFCLAHTTTALPGPLAWGTTSLYFHTGFGPVFRVAFNGGCPKAMLTDPDRQS